MKRKQVTAARKSGQGKFSLTQMRGTLSEVVDTLHRSIAKQNPGADIDSLENDIRALVMRHGHGMKSEEAKVILASSQVPPYNLAGDVICLAYDLYKEGKPKSALKMMASALESDGIEDLVRAIDDTNAKTDNALAAAASDELDGGPDNDLFEAEQEDEEKEDNDGSDQEEIASDLDDDYLDEDLDGEDDSEEESEDDEEYSSDEDEEDEEDEEEGITDEVIASLASNIRRPKKKVVAEDDDGDTESVATRKKKRDLEKRQTAAPKSIEERAFLNKLSLSGKTRHRSIAKNVAKMAKK